MAPMVLTNVKDEKAFCFSLTTLKDQENRRFQQEEPI